MTFRTMGLSAVLVTLVACGGAAAPRSADAAPSAAKPAAAPGKAREYAETTLPGGEGPVPGTAWEKSRPQWLDGELLPKRAMVRDGVDRKDPIATKEKSAFESTKAMATGDRFAWGSHACSAPIYEQRVVTLETFLADQNKPSPTHKTNDLWWQVRVTCAPGKGEIGLTQMFRVIREGGKLDSDVRGDSEQLQMYFQPLKEVKQPEAALPAPEPGAKLTTGEGPLPGREWESGRPAWFDGEWKTSLVLFQSDSEMNNPVRTRERDSLEKERLVISGSRVSYAGKVCTEPQFEQRLVKHFVWLKEQSMSGGGYNDQQDWAVRVKCGKGKGNFTIALSRGIPKGKLADHFEGMFDGFSVSFRQH